MKPGGSFGRSLLYRSRRLSSSTRTGHMGVGAEGYISMHPQKNLKGIHMVIVMGKGQTITSEERGTDV